MRNIFSFSFPFVKQWIWAGASQRNSWECFTVVVLLFLMTGLCCVSAGLTVPAPLVSSGANLVQFSIQLVAWFTELWAEAFLSGVTSSNDYVLTGCYVVAGDAGQALCMFASYVLLHLQTGLTRQTAGYVFKTTVLPQWMGTFLLSSLRKNFI